MCEKAKDVVRKYLAEKGIKDQTYDIWTIEEHPSLHNYTFVTSIGYDGTIYDLYYDEGSHSWELAVYEIVDRRIIPDC